MIRFWQTSITYYDTWGHFWEVNEGGFLTLAQAMHRLREVSKTKNMHFGTKEERRAKVKEVTINEEGWYEKTVWSEYI